MKQNTTMLYDGPFSVRIFFLFISSVGGYKYQISTSRSHQKIKNQKKEIERNNDRWNRA